MMKRRSFMQTAVAGAFAAGISGALGSQSNKPNIIYILADDLGYGDLGCYGQELINTPHIDRMAEQGIKFTQHYAGSSICAPARCVLLTGLHTGRAYVRNNRRLPFEGNVPIPADSQTISQLLKRAGYTNGCIGKWGLGFPGSTGDPLNHGFDLFYGFNCQRHAHTYYPHYLWRNEQREPIPGNRGGARGEYAHDLCTQEAFKFIRENKDNPFFLYLPYQIPHVPFEVPELGEYADRDWDENHKIQAAMISRLDRDVGRLIELLRELGIEDNTLVIFTSDNGPHAKDGTLEKFNAAGPLRASKGAFYEGGIRVPFVARWPGRIPPGRVSDHISGFQDMLPTFAALARVDVPEPTDGISMLPTLFGEGVQREHEYLYWERGNNCAVREGYWKALIRNFSYPSGRVQLYDLERDIGEQNNVASDNPEIVARMREIVEHAHVPNDFYDLTVDDFKEMKKAADPRS